MPKKTVGQLKNELKTKYLNMIIQMLMEQDEDVGIVAGNKINLPCVDEEENERWIEITVSIPVKSAGEAYDGYEAREDYEFTQQENQMKKEIAEQNKQKKLEEAKRKKADQKMRREAEKAQLEERKQKLEEYLNE